MANFVVSGTPHVRSKESIQSIMRDVIIALVPATAAGIYYFGLRALILIVAAIISAVFFEWLYEKITKKPVTINDLSAVVTGLLLAMNLPASAPVWVAIVSGLFISIPITPFALGCSFSIICRPLTILSGSSRPSGGSHM